MNPVIFSNRTGLKGKGTIVSLPSANSKKPQMLRLSRPKKNQIKKGSDKTSF